VFVPFDILFELAFLSLSLFFGGAFQDFASTEERKDGIVEVLQID